MIFLKLGDRNDVQRFQIKAKWIICFLGENVCKDLFYVCFGVADSLRQQINIRGAPGIISLVKRVKENAALQHEVLFVR